MNYISAKDVLPIEIIKQIQCYVDGQIIYIPKSEPKKKDEKLILWQKENYLYEIQISTWNILAGFQLSNSPKNIFLWKKVFKES